MSEKIKIKAILDSGKVCFVKSTSVVNAIATFISNHLTKDEVDRLQAILKVAEKNAQIINKSLTGFIEIPCHHTGQTLVYEERGDSSLVLNNVYLKPAMKPTPTSNAVLAERIVELDRRLSQYMEVGKNHVESINGLIEEVSRLRNQNADLKESNEASSKQIFELLAEVKALDTGKLDSEHVIANFRRRVIHLEDVIKGYENNVHTLEQKIALQTSHAASLENQLADKVRELEVQSDNIKNVTHRYLGVCEALRQYRNAWTHLTSQKTGTREYNESFNTLAALFKLFPTALMPKLTEPSPDIQHRVVDWTAPAERGQEGY